jgi:hypothetical protein
MQKLLLISLAFLAACSIQQEGRDLQVRPAPLFSEQHWQITAQDRQSCTISAGEIDIIQRRKEGGIIAQVNITRPFMPGDQYKILIRDHIYETSRNIYPVTVSKAIIDDIRVNDTIYTEWQTVTPGDKTWRRGVNKIKTYDFEPRYQECARAIAR